MEKIKRIILITKLIVFLILSLNIQVFGQIPFYTIWDTGMITFRAPKEFRGTNECYCDTIITNKEKVKIKSIEFVGSNLTSECINKIIDNNIDILKETVSLYIRNEYSLNEFPTSLLKLKKLERIDISKSSINTLPIDLNILENLTALALIDIYVSEENIIQTLDNLSDQITALYLYNLNMKNFPLAICKMKQLKELGISCYYMYDLPECIFELEHMLHCYYTISPNAPYNLGEIIKFNSKITEKIRNEYNNKGIKIITY